jgi:mersacidin/lichenicidin family type 2 lantibiotic
MKREIDIARAWKDADYRAGLSREELVSLPENPVGELEFELSDDELSLIAGAEGDGDIGIPTPPTLTAEPICKCSVVIACPQTIKPGCPPPPATVPMGCSPPQPTILLVDCPSFVKGACTILEGSKAVL